MAPIKIPKFQWQRVALPVLIFVALIYLFQGPCAQIGNNNLISYTAFRQQLKKGNIQEITFTGQKITGKFLKPLKKKDAEGGQEPLSDFVTYMPPLQDAGLFPLLEEKKVIIHTKPARGDSLWGNLLSYIPLLFLFLIIFSFLQRFRMQGHEFSSMSQSRARRYEQTQKRTAFDDVAGAKEAKRELQEVVEFLKNPLRFQRLGGKIPKGVLLVGPPGTGKTLLARAVAGEAQVPFYSISGSDFMEMFVGVGASRVRAMFAEAKKTAPSILFIDELDSIGRHRGVGIMGGRDEREQTLNQLLSEMDGFETHDSVIVLAATNRPDVLDSALLRPGRFDRQVTVDLPSMEDRFEILKTHGKNKPFEKGVDLKKIARGTPGFSGAELENLLNEAAILAARKGKDAIGEDDLGEIRDKVLMGLERMNLNITAEEKKLLAYHEGGHATVAAILPHTDPLYKVTIIPRGRAMGVTQQLPEEKYVYSKDYILDRVAVMLGGRAAEELVFGTSTSGAESDLKQAVELARKMVLDWGMGEKLANLAFGGQRGQFVEGTLQQQAYSELTAEKIDHAVEGIIEESFTRAKNTLQDHREGLDRVAEVLMEKEMILGNEVMELIGVQKLL